MKKLLFVINTLGYGGAERALFSLFEALDPKDYEISLFVLTGQGELIRELPSHVKILNKDYNACSVLTKEGRKHLRKRVLHAGICKGIFIKRAGYILKNLCRMQKQQRIQVDKLCWRILAEGAPEPDEAYDLAAAYLEGGSTYYVADRVKAKKKAAFVHIDYKQAGYGKDLDLDCYQKMDHIFAVSDEVKNQFLEVYSEYGHKISVFHNMVDQKRIRRMSEEGDGFADDFQGIRILTVGRLTGQKRYDVAIDAMAELKKISPVPIRWYVMGEGELREQLELQIHRLGLENDFKLMGVKANPFPYYRECDLYVHATGYEGKSIAIQEAQTLGKPVLATDCSGNREQIEQDVNGRMCSLDPGCVSAEILWMIEHPQECKVYGEQAKSRMLYSTTGFDEFKALIG